VLVTSGLRFQARPVTAIVNAKPTERLAGKLAPCKKTADFLSANLKIDLGEGIMAGISALVAGMQVVVFGAANVALGSYDTDSEAVQLGD